MMDIMSLLILIASLLFGGCIKRTCTPAEINAVETVVEAVVKAETSIDVTPLLPK